MTIDIERDEILKDIPQLDFNEQQHHVLTKRRLNAFICKDASGRLNIYPVNGGWLGVECNDLLGDLGPFAG